MSDAESFSRFIVEMQALLSAIESHCAEVTRVETSDERLLALREIARLAHAVAALALAFDVDDLRSLAEALARSTTEAAADANTNSAAGTTHHDDALMPPGWRDTLDFMRWRVRCFARAGQLELPTAQDLTRIRWLTRTLQAPLSEAHHFAASPDLFSDASELELEERALLKAFSTASIRKRDPQADARLLASIAETPAYMARTDSGADVPVYGALSDDELDEVEPEFQFKFVQEAHGQLRELGRLIMEYERRPGDMRTLDQIGSIAHTIKGNAGLMRFPGLSTIGQNLLDVVRGGQEGADASSSDFVRALGRFLGLLDQALVAAEKLKEPAPALIEESQRLCDTALRPQSDADRAANQSPPDAPSRFADVASDDDTAAQRELVLRIEEHSLDLLMNQLSALAANRGAVTRNRSEIARAQAEMHATIARLREKSAQIADAHPLTFGVGDSAGRFAVPDTLDGAPDDVATPSATPSGALRASWSNLQLEQYTEMDTALRALAEVVTDVTANYTDLNSLLNQLGQLTETQEMLSRDIQDDAMSIRLARLVEIIPRLRYTVNSASSTMGKQVGFDAQGARTEIDRLLLEELEHPLIHLALNAVAHGIEAPEEREEQGKPREGRVWINAYNLGSDVVIEVGDDGRGVNPYQLVGAAIGAQLISSEDARTLSQAQALSFMFHSGITTIQQHTAGRDRAMAGHGVGLADVARAIHQLKGSISLRSERGKGTVFQIRVPVSLSTAPVLEVSAEGQIFALPFAMVEYSAMVEPGALHPVEPTEPRGGLREWQLTLTPPTRADAESAEPAAEESAPASVELRAYALAETLGFQQDASALRRAVVVQLHGQQVALLVESVGEGDVRVATVRPLPPHLRRRVVRGAIVLPEDGQVALLIDPLEALAQRVTGAQIMLRPTPSRAEPRMAAPCVLIVDDSVTIRKSLEQTLNQAGFKTTLARDGIEALERMEAELPRVVILDVEMPRLSGFELLAIMRDSPQYTQTRVVMLTSRAADKHRDFALANGADAYLVKPCPQEILIETIRSLLTESEPE
jgi:chemosensory pili system protein ChpA (sensor histidine kinase/response regulator)